MNIGHCKDLDIAEVRKQAAETQPIYRGPGPMGRHRAWYDVVTELCDIITELQNNQKKE